MVPLVNYEEFSIDESRFDVRFGVPNFLQLVKAPFCGSSAAEISLNDRVMHPFSFLEEGVQERILGMCSF